MSNAKVAPTVAIAKVGTFDLAECHVERVLSKKVAAAVGRTSAVIRRWATLSTSSVEAIIGEDAETGEDIAILLESSRYSVKAPAPVKADGSPVALPGTAVVSAFGEKARNVALAAFTTGKRADGSPVVHVYGAVEYVRPSGASYVLHVKVAPIDNGRTWRVGAMLAQ